MGHLLFQITVLIYMKQRLCSAFISLSCDAQLTLVDIRLIPSEEQKVSSLQAMKKTKFKSYNKIHCLPHSNLLSFSF